MRSGAEECVRLAVVTSDKIVAEEGPRIVTNAAFFRSPATLSKTFVQRQRSTRDLPFLMDFSRQLVIERNSFHLVIHFAGGVDMMA
jgi:hypothetical protein